MKQSEVMSREWSSSRFQLFQRLLKEDSIMTSTENHDVEAFLALLDGVGFFLLFFLIRQ